MKKRLLSSLPFLFLFLTFLAAQDESPPVQVTHAEFIGKTPPLRDLLPMRATTPEKRAQVKSIKKTIPNFIGRGQRPVANPGALPQGEDRIRQSSANRNTGLVIEPLVNIDGINSAFSPVNPPDPDGDIGRDHYIQTVNATFFQIFDKQGNAISEPIAANTLWSTIGFSSAGDPIVLYDQEVDRWILTEFPNGNQLLFAITETSDPMGSWMVYNFATPNFPDYPKYSIWPNAYVVTTNEGGPGSLPVYLIDREAMLSGAPMVDIQRLVVPGVGGGPGFQVATPIDWSGNAAPPPGAEPMIIQLNDDAWGEVAQDQLRIRRFSVDWDNPNNTTFSTDTLPTAPFDTYPCAAEGVGFACIPQPNGNGIDGLPEVVMNQTHYRNLGAYEAIVLNFITDADGNNLSGIRWIELRRTPGNDWTVYQEGTYAPDDGNHRFMGAIAMDAAGNIGLAYSVSGLDTFPSLRFTGRRASDPLGQMTVEEFEITPGFSNNPGSRYGDYASMSVDPADERTFWFTGEYRNNNGWGTRIVSFVLPRDTIDIGPVALLAPADSPDLAGSETVRIAVKNFGLDTQFVYNVGYIFEDGDPVIEAVDSLLAPDSTYLHEFAATVDFSEVRDYEFRIFTGLPSDQAVFNDTLRASVAKLPRFDAGVSSISNLEDIICIDSAQALINITNFGALPLDSLILTVILNGDTIQIIEWFGLLEPGATEEIAVILEGLLNGNNELIAVTSMPNGEMDETPENDTASRVFGALLGSVSIFLELTTDDFPEETTWQVTDASGNVIFSGGPYTQESTLILEEWCLDPEECYTFTIFDSFGDGICCAWGTGDYQIVDADGLPLASLLVGNFGEQEDNDFCATFECTLTAGVSSSPESAEGLADGVIVISPENGIAPLQYSIDGGMTFQSDNVFAGLSAGDYLITVQDGAGCIYEETVTILLCALEVMAEVTNESGAGAMDGTITITAANAIGPLRYSIDDGDTYQDDPEFTGLSNGIYDIMVQDSLGCTAQLQVMLDVDVATRETRFGHTITVAPNPTAGIFRMDVAGLQGNSLFLNFQILNAKGQVVQYSRLVRYDGDYTGQVSLVDHPAGVYFVRFLDPSVDRVVRIVKN